MKIIVKDPQIFEYLNNYLSSNDLCQLEDKLIIYSLHSINKRNSSKAENEISLTSNLAKKPSISASEYNSDDEFDEQDENLSKTKLGKSRTKSEVVDFRRGSFSDYYHFVKEDLFQNESAEDINISNKIITEVKSHMEMSKVATPGSRMKKSDGQVIEVK